MEALNVLRKADSALDSVMPGASNPHLSIHHQHIHKAFKTTTSTLPLHWSDQHAVQLATSARLTAH